MRYIFFQAQQMEYRREVEEMNIQLQQEAYIARVLGQKSHSKDLSIDKNMDSVNSYSGRNLHDKTKHLPKKLSSKLDTKRNQKPSRDRHKLP